MHQSRIALTVLFLLFLSSISTAKSQDNNTNPQPLGSETKCEQQQNGISIESDISAELLKLFEQMPNSISVKAFLINYVNEHGNEAHWLHTCADNFLKDDFEDLKPDAYKDLTTNNILRALREEIGDFSDIPELNFDPNQISILTSPPENDSFQNQLSTTIQPDLLVSLTDFIIDRAKKEIVVKYLGDIFKWIQQGENNLQIVFPTTFDVMQSVLKDTSSSNAGLLNKIPMSVWRASLSKDIQQLPRSLVSSGETLCGGNPSCGDFFNQYYLISEVGYKLLDGQSPFDVFRDLPDVLVKIELTSSDEEEKWWISTKQAIKMVSLLANTYEAQSYIPLNETYRFDFLLSSKTFENTSIKSTFVKTLLFESRPANSIDSFFNSSNFENSIIKTMEYLEVLQSNLSIKSNDADRSTKIMEATLNTAISGISLAKYLSVGQQDMINELKSLETRWKDFSEILTSVLHRDYGLAMVHTTALLNSISNFDGVSKEIFNEKMISIISLATNLAEAKNGEQLQDAFVSAASPIGGWERKRNRTPGIGSLTAYPGISFGREFLYEAETTPGSFFTGPSLPLGYEVQLLRRQEDYECKKIFCSLGLFFPIIDLGTLVSYRINPSDDVDEIPNTSIQQVFAPGIYLSMGIQKSPFSILVGGQFVPSLREISDNNSTEESVNAFQVGVSVVLDLVLFDF